MPVDVSAAGRIDQAVGDGRLTTLGGTRTWLLTTTDAPADVAGLFRQVDGGCVFHQPMHRDADGGPGGRRCAVHAVLGPEGLPATCRHFPRVCLIDDRGVRVALSHYCPTAAAMLVHHQGPVTIVSGPPPVPGLVVPEGLDVRGGLPPRLSPRVLADWPGFTAWEAHVVDVLAGPGAEPGPPEAAVAWLAGEAERLAAWRPGRDTLSDEVARLASWPRPHVEDGPEPHSTRRSMASRFAMAQAACRPPWIWPDAPLALDTVDARWVAPAWPATAPAVRRFLASKAFAAWTAYQVDATRALVAWLRLALAVVRVECGRQCATAARLLDADLLAAAVRQADLLLVHYADAARLAAAVADG